MRDPDSGGHGDLVVADRDRRAKRGEHAVGDGDRAGRVQIFEQGGEFVATGASHESVVAGASAQAPSDGLQQCVADVVAEPVVDLLEVVEVDKQQRDGVVAVAVEGQGTGETLGEQAPVGESGERVVVDKVLELSLERLSACQGGVEGVHEARHPQHDQPEEREAAGGRDGEVYVVATEDLFEEHARSDQ